MDGITPTTATADPLADIAAMLGAIGYTNASRLYFIAAPDVGIAVATTAASGARLFPEAGVSGGTLLGLPLVISDGMPVATLALVDATGIAGAEGGVTVDSSEHAALSMLDNPTMHIGTVGSPTAPVHSTAVSMFQTNSIAIRCIATFGCAIIRPNSVTAIDSVNW